MRFSMVLRAGGTPIGDNRSANTENEYGSTGFYSRIGERM